MSKVFIGVGHGGSDPGATANGFREKDLNLSIALACNEALVRHGVITLMSRTLDENDSLNEIVEEPLPVVPEEHFVSEGQVEQENAISETDSVDADIESSETDSVQVVEDAVDNVNVEDNMMAFDFKDNIDYSNVNVDTYSSDVISDNTITEFSDDLFTSDLDTDIFADSTLHVDKIDIDDNFNSLIISFIIIIRITNRTFLFFVFVI